MTVYDLFHKFSLTREERDEAFSESQMISGSDGRYNGLGAAFLLLANRIIALENEVKELKQSGKNET
jgi:hypothetical protein